MTSVLRYPYEALTETTDYLQLTIKKYPGISSGNTDPIAGANFGTNQSAIDVSNTAAGALKPAQLSENGVIILPMPSNIEDSNSVSYDGDSLNGLTAFGLDAFKKVSGLNIGNLLDKSKREGELTKIFGDVNDGRKRFGVTQDNVTNYLNNYLAASAVNIFGSNVSVNSLLARTEGKILNPNMELLFNNVTLRTFRFSFKMTPRDDIEALQVKSIIRSLKRNMAAKTTTGDNLFLETPNIFELQYRKGNKPHPFLHRFKQCALSDMSVNYTGENVYATYNDGSPISVILNLTFKELVPIYQSDYDKDVFGNDVSENSLTYGVDGNTQKDVEGVGY